MTKKWNYLKDMNYRYEDASKWVNEYDQVIDLNIGDSKFKNLIRPASYISNDLVNRNADCLLPDDEFVEKLTRCSVLSCFGIGGYEITGYEEESKTVTDSIIATALRLAPEYILLEYVTKFEPVFERIKKETGYRLVHTKKTKSGPRWVHDRVFKVLKIQVKHTYKQYQKLAKRVKNGFTVKMDAWQECQSKYPIKADLYVELQEYVKDKAENKGYKVVLGSITNIPLPDKSVKTLIDTSTIDHIPDYQKALNEYHRVLEDDSTLLLCTWVTQGPTYQGSKPDQSGTNQFYFNETEFEADLKQYFVVEEKGYLLNRKGDSVVYYIGTKK